MTMRLLFDFNQFGTLRPRDIVKFLGYALAAKFQGHDVMARDDHLKLGRFSEEWLTAELSAWDGEEVDVYFPNVDLVRAHNHLTELSPVVILSHRYWENDVMETRLASGCKLYVAPKHSTFGAQIMSVPHAVGFGVMQWLVDNGLWRAYLTDDLEAIREAVIPTETKRIAGFFGEGLYGRPEMAAQLPGWCQCHLYQGGPELSVPEYLAWLKGCRVAIDFPGSFPRTYRFAEAVLLGVPVLCVPDPRYQPAIQINELNAVALRRWDDRARLDRLMDDLGLIRVMADRSYRRCWSLAAQVREVIEAAVYKGDEPEVLDEPAAPMFGLRPPKQKAVAEGLPTKPKPRAKMVGEQTRRLLIVYDCNGWAYHLRAAALKKHAPLNWVVTLATWEEFKRQDTLVAAHDVTFLLDYAHTDHVVAARRRHRATRRPLIVSYNADTSRRQEWWGRIAGSVDFVIAVNRERYWHNEGHQNCCCIANGIDLDVFGVQVPIVDRPDRVLWCGRDDKGVKGYEGVLLPLADLLRAERFTTDFRLIRTAEDVFALDRQVAWYQTGGYIVCGSESEGTANPISEGVACGCAAVSTRVGTITEWGRSKRNCVLTARSPEALRDGLLYARQCRERLAAAGGREVQRYDYRRHAGFYYAVFERLIRGLPVGRFIHTDTTPGKVLKG